MQGAASADGENDTGPRDPEELEAAVGSRPRARFSADDAVGAVHLTVADLERSLAFYERASSARPDSAAGTAARRSAPAARELLGPRRGAGRRARRGAHGPLPLRAARAGAAPTSPRWLAHAARDAVALTGLSDHFVSEAIYLNDPDGHGIEIYWDRPREIWEGQVAERMTTLPLDVQDLMGEHPEAEPARRLRRPSGRHRDGARPPQGGLDPGDGRLLPRRPRLRR